VPRGQFTKAYGITISLPEKRRQTVLSSISGGTQAVTGFPRPKLEENSRHATQQSETHDHQWWLDVSVVRQVSTSKQTRDDDVIVHQPSTEVFQQDTVAQYHGGNDASKRTNETVLSLFKPRHINGHFCGKIVLLVRDWGRGKNPTSGCDFG